MSLSRAGDGEAMAVTGSVPSRFSKRIRQSTTPIDWAAKMQIGSRTKKRRPRRINLRQHIRIAMICRSLKPATVAMEASVDRKELESWLSDAGRGAPRNFRRNLEDWLSWMREGKRANTDAKGEDYREDIVSSKSWLRRDSHLPCAQHVDSHFIRASQWAVKSRKLFERSEIKNDESDYVLRPTATEPLHTNSSRNHSLVPVRIDIDIGGIHFVDAFLWRVDEHMCSPEVFAEKLVLDERLPQTFVDPIAASTRRQIFSHTQAIKMRRVDEKRSETLEFVRIICLDITIGRVVFHDQFEWDLSCDRNDPVEFARVLCKDLQLPGPFEAAIAHAIQEQLSRPCIADQDSLNVERFNVARVRLPPVQAAAGEKQKKSTAVVDKIDDLHGSSTTLGDSFTREPFRSVEESTFWCPIVAELSCPERDYLKVLDRPRAFSSRKDRGTAKENASSGDAEVRRSKGPMVLTWVAAPETKMPRQVHAFTVYLHEMREYLEETGMADHIKDTQQYIEGKWQKLPSAVHKHYSMVAAMRNAKKNDAWCRATREDGVFSWEEDEVDRKKLKGGGFLGDLLSKPSAPPYGFRMNHKVRNEASNLLYLSRVEERRESLSKRRRLEGDSGE